jgi:hypothetical protein
MIELSLVHLKWSSFLAVGKCLEFTSNIMCLGCEEGTSVVLMEYSHMMETQAFVVNFYYALIYLKFIQCIVKGEI